MKALLIVAGLFFSIFGAVIAYFAASDPGQEYELKFVLPIDARQMPKPVAPPSVQSWSAGEEESHSRHRWTRRGWESAGHAGQTTCGISRAGRRRIRVSTAEIAEQKSGRFAHLGFTRFAASSRAFVHTAIGLAMALIDPKTLPYRPCVGIMLLNAEGLIWIGRRFDDLVSQEYQQRWQMPQGGIDTDEDPKVAALRELHEETGVTSAKHHRRIEALDSV